MAVLAREMLEFGLMEPNHLIQVIFLKSFLVPVLLAKMKARVGLSCEIDF